MFISPYDTTVGKTLKGVDRVRNALEIAYVGKTLSGQGGVDDSPVVELIDGKNGLEDIPAFGHPLVFNTVLDGSKLAIDQRAYARVPVNAEFAGSATDIRNAREYNFLAQRAWLQIGWQTLPTNDIEQISKIPMRVFCDWVAGQVSQKLGLDDQQRRDVAIITGWYYLCLFKNQVTDQVTDMERMSMTRAIQSCLRYDFQVVGLVTETLPYMAKLEDYVKGLKQSGITPRLSILTTALVFQITSFSWVGGYAKEVAGIALEHPPTFLMLCASGDNDKGYRDTILGRLMRETRKLASREVDDYLKNINHLLEKCRGIRSF